MKRILVPIDFSPAMKCVLERARELAEALAAEIHLVHVREISAVPVFPAASVGYPGIGMPEMGMPLGGPSFPPEATPDLEGKGPLDAIQAGLTRSGLRSFVHERDGSVVEEILQTANEISADLIVMGSHGHGSVYNLLVGSVTEGVLKAGQRPLLLVPAPKDEK